MCKNRGRGHIKTWDSVLAKRILHSSQNQSLKYSSSLTTGIFQPESTLEAIDELDPEVAKHTT